MFLLDVSEVCVFILAALCKHYATGRARKFVCPSVLLEVLTLSALTEVSWSYIVFYMRLHKHMKTKFLYSQFAKSFISYILLLCTHTFRLFIWAFHCKYGSSQTSKNGGIHISIRWKLKVGCNVASKRHIWRFTETNLHAILPLYITCDIY